MTRQSDDGKQLSDADLKRVCDLIYVRTGMVFGEAKRYFIERRILDRLDQSGLASLQNYLALLRHDEAEIEQLINSFTVNETYFYREAHQLQCMSGCLLPDIVRSRRPGDLVRIWSVPCSTGEEPYSIALWLLENWPMVDVYNIEIMGSDIDTRVLAQAAEGLYGERALARLPASVREAYFEPCSDARWQLITDLRESVRFTAINLMDQQAMAAQGCFDLIFCRNVLIYFDDVSRRRAAQNLYDTLRPGGFVCLGHSESMARMSDRFTLRRFPDAIVYQRPPT